MRELRAGYILFDTWYQSDDVASYTFDPGSAKRVWVRKQDRDNYGTISEWSDPAVFTQAVGRGRRVAGVHVVLPEPLDRYVRENEAQFRKSVERSFQDTQQLILQQGRARGYEEWKNILTLDDDEEFIIPLSGSQAAGFVRVAAYGSAGAVSEGGLWLVGGSDGAVVVTLVSGTTNTDDADTDAKLCVYTGGVEVYIKNRLGESVAILADAAWR